jgi:hypothetical protein
MDNEIVQAAKEILKNANVDTTKISSFVSEAT